MAVLHAQRNAVQASRAARAASAAGNMGGRAGCGLEKFLVLFVCIRFSFCVRYINISIVLLY